jgi:hypothetical protein
MHLYRYDNIYQITEVNYRSRLSYLATDTMFNYEAAGTATFSYGTSGNTVEVCEYDVYDRVGASDASHRNRYGAGMNLYRYCNDDPTTPVGPTGLHPENCPICGQLNCESVYCVTERRRLGIYYKQEYAASCCAAPIRNPLLEVGLSRIRCEKAIHDVLWDAMKLSAHQKANWDWDTMGVVVAYSDAMTVVENFGTGYKPIRLRPGAETKVLPDKVGKAPCLIWLDSGVDPTTGVHWWHCRLGARDRKGRGCFLGPLPRPGIRLPRQHLDHRFQCIQGLGER